jgi:hypothetical protein
MGLRTAKDTMNRTVSLVQRVEIASPCTASWAEMLGDERVRFCDHCKLNVYNLSIMSESEGEALIIEKEGKLCARIYRRRDGTIITRDCPVGLAAIRSSVNRMAIRSLAAVICIGSLCIAAIGGNANDDDDRNSSARTTYQRTLESLGHWLREFQGQAVVAGDMVIVHPNPPLAPQTSANPNGDQ